MIRSKRRCDFREKGRQCLEEKLAARTGSIVEKARENGNPALRWGGVARACAPFERSQGFGLGAGSPFLATSRGVLESFCEERNDPACEIFDGRRGAAGRQVHLPPLCHVSGARRRHKRVAELFCRRRLPQHTRLRERAWRGSKNWKRHRTRDRTRRARIEKQLAGAGCGKFWNDDAAARWNSGRAEFLFQVDGRRFPTKAAYEACACAAARNGRRHSGSRR